MLSFYLFFGIIYALLLRGLGKFWKLDMASGLPRQKGVTMCRLSWHIETKQKPGGFA
jgi:hypothetical protein